jgi:hypothetical protein
MSDRKALAREIARANQTPLHRNPPRAQEQAHARRSIDLKARAEPSPRNRSPALLRYRAAVGYPHVVKDSGLSAFGIRWAICCFYLPNIARLELAIVNTEGRTRQRDNNDVTLNLNMEPEGFSHGIGDFLRGKFLDRGLKCVHHENIRQNGR